MSGARLAEIDEALQRLGRLRTEGMLSEAEFVQAKTVLLTRGSLQSAVPPPVIEHTGRMMLPWLVAALFAVLVLAGVLLLVPSVRLPVGRFVTGRPTTIAPAPHPVPAVKRTDRWQIAITDDVLQYPWNMDGDGADHFLSKSCLNEPVTLTNRAAQVLALGIYAYQPPGATKPLGTLKPGDSIRFTPHSTGQYLIARNPSGQSKDLYELDVSACPDGPR